MRKYEINIWHDGQGFTDTRYASVENDLKPVSFYISISNDGHGAFTYFLMKLDIQVLKMLVGIYQRELRLR